MVNESTQEISQSCCCTYFASTRYIRHICISIAAIRIRKLNKCFVKSSSNGAECLEIMNNEDRTFKNIMDKNAYYTYNLHSLNKNLPYCYCIDWQKFQLPGKLIIVCSESILLLGKNYHSIINRHHFFTTDDNLILHKKYFHSVEDTQIAEVPNKNMIETQAEF